MIVMKNPRILVFIVFEINLVTISSKNVKTLDWERAVACRMAPRRISGHPKAKIHVFLNNQIPLCESNQIKCFSLAVTSYKIEIPLAIQNSTSPDYHWVQAGEIRFKPVRF